MWMEVAVLCRYGHQDVHKVLGIQRPLTAMERALFVRALQEHFEAEVNPRDVMGVPKVDG